MAVTEDQPAIESQKRLLRRRFRAARSRLSSDELRAAGLSILHHLESEDRWRDARRVGLFAATGGEPDMRPVFEAIVAGGRTALLPRCADDLRLEFVAVRAWDDLRPGRYGLAEPEAEPCAECWQPGDLVLVPGLAFDLQGGRLGQGSGYFDRSFHGADVGRPWLLGTGLELQITRGVPMDLLDRRMDGLVTEAGVRWFGSDD